MTINSQFIQLFLTKRSTLIFARLAESSKNFRLTAHEVSFEISAIFCLKERTNFVEFRLHSFCTVL